MRRTIWSLEARARTDAMSFSQSPASPSALRRFPAPVPRSGQSARALLLGFALGLATFPALPSAAEAQTRPAAVQSSIDSAQAAPLILRGDTLFVVRARVGSFSPAERVAAIEIRLRTLASDEGITLSVLEGEGGDDLIAGDRVVMTVTDADARADGVERHLLSARWAAALGRGLNEERPQVLAADLANGLLRALIATAALLIILWIVLASVRRIVRAISAWRGSRIAPVRFQKFELLSAEKTTAVLIGLVRFVRTALVAVALAVYVPMMLGFFPQTRALSRSILHSALTPLGQLGQALLGYLPNLFVIAALCVVTWYLLAAIHAVFRALEHGNLAFEGFDREWAEPTYKIVRFLVLAFAAVVVFPYLPGAHSEAFKGVSLFLGVLFSLGSSSAISNLVAGVVLTYTRAFRLGDRVQLNDTVGDVVSNTLLVTRLRTIKNVDVTVPNSMVLSSHVINYSAIARERGLILNPRVTIGYDAPWRQVHELLIDAARKTPGILAEPAPFVLQVALDDFFVHYELNAYTNDAQRMAVTYSALYANIQDAFNAAGMEIMSPHFTAARDGNRMAIPTADLPSGYTAPSFRVTNTGAGAPEGR